MIAYIYRAFTLVLLTFLLAGTSSASQKGWNSLSKILGKCGIFKILGETDLNNNNFKNPTHIPFWVARHSQSQILLELEIQNTPCTSQVTKQGQYLATVQITSPLHWGKNAAQCIHLNPTTIDPLGLGPIPPVTTLKTETCDIKKGPH